MKEFPRKSNARSQIARFFKSEGYLYLRERFLVSVCCAGEICAVSYTEGAQNRQASDLPVLKCVFVGYVAEDSLGLPHGEAIVVHGRDAVHRILHFTLE